MIYGIYGIKDRLRGFVDLKLIGTDAEAMRDFAFMCSESNAYMYFNRDDWSIYRFGWLNGENGELTIDEPEVIMRGSDLVENKKTVS